MKPRFLPIVAVVFLASGSVSQADGFSTTQILQTCQNTRSAESCLAAAKTILKDYPALGAGTMSRVLGDQMDTINKQLDEADSPVGDDHTPPAQPDNQPDDSDTGDPSE